MSDPDPIKAARMAAFFDQPYQANSAVSDEQAVKSAAKYSAHQLFHIRKLLGRIAVVVEKRGMDAWARRGNMQCVGNDAACTSLGSEARNHAHFPRRTPCNS